MFELVRAHVALARTELGQIAANVKAVAIQASLAIGVAIFALTLIAIGSILFLGEWLFGSIGWGVVHGTGLSVAVIVACIGLILGERAGAIVRDALLGVAVGIVVGVVLGLSLTNEAWGRVTDAMDLGVAPEWRLLVVAESLSAIGGAVIGLTIGVVRGGASGLVGGLVLGAILGALVGGLTAIAYGSQVGSAMGLLTALVLFTILQCVGIWRRGIDADAFKARFYPTQTIETTKETLEWLREQSPAGRP